MPLRLLPWSPEYGTSLQAGIEPDADAEDGAARPTLEYDVEPEWRAITPDPAAPLPSAVQVVDGVRRVDAHAIDDGSNGEPRYAIFGSLAVGAVRCVFPQDGRGGHAQVIEDSVGVARHYLQAGEGDAPDYRAGRGAHALRFIGSTPPRTQDANDLVNALNTLMRDAEARLAEALSEDEAALTIVDGPIYNPRSPGLGIAGYIKRVGQWYLDADRLRLVSALRPGQRTPIARLRGVDAHRDRYIWYVCLADMQDRYHALGGVARLEAPARVPEDRAIALADTTVRVLPRLASSPVRDPRAPQNLTPVGALERALTRRLGERDWVRRLLAASVGRADGGLLAGEGRI